MNTSNVMSVSNTAGSQGKTVRGATEIKEKNGPGRGKGSAFDDVLAQSQEGSLTPKDRKDLTDSADSADKEIKALGNAAEGTVDEKDAGMASNTGKLSGETISGEEKGPEWSAGSIAAVNPLQMGAVRTETEPMMAEEPIQAADALNIEAEDIPMDWPIVGKQEEIPKGNLHSLLPPSEEQTAKNKQMLAMLSGQMVKEPGQEEKPVTLSYRGQSVPIPEGNQTPDGFGPELPTGRFQADKGGPQVPRDPLSAQSLQMARNLPADGRVNLFAENPSAENLPQGSVAGQQRMGEVPGVARPVEEPVGTLIANQAAAASPARQNQPIAQQESVVLGGVQIEVEDVPADPVRELPQQLAQQEQRQSQQQPQQQMPFQRFLAGESAPEVPSGKDEGTAPPAEGTAQGATFQQAVQHASGGGQVGQSAPAAQVRDDFHVTQQIVEQARLIRSQESTEMVIRLKPEHLGELTMRISVSSEGAVTASFFSDNAQVRHIVENSLVQLRQELENQGIKVDKAEVYAGLSDGQLPQEQGQQAWQQQGRGNPTAPLRSLDADMESFEETATGLAEALSGDSVEEGVNYLV